MKQKEKAKRYDKALERAKKLQETCDFQAVVGWCEYIFPELKESEDERIRNVIRGWIYTQPTSFFDNGISKEEIVAWLEKQAEKDKLIQELGKYKVKYTQEVLEKHINSMSNKDDERLRKTTIAFLKDFAEQGYENAVECIDWLEKQGNKTEEHIFRPIAGSTIDKAARQAIDKVTNGENVVFSFNGFYMKIYKDTTIDNIINSYNDFCKKQGKNKKEINNFDVLPGLYKCVHRMFDGTPEGRLLFEIDNVYKCLSKHDRAEFEVSYGHSVYLEDPVVRKHFIPFEKQGEPKWSDDDEQYLLVCKNALRKYQVSDKWDAEIISKWLEDKLKQGKPKWAEEDDDNLNMAIYFMRSENTPYSPTDVEPVVEWLCGLKQRMGEK